MESKKPEFIRFIPILYVRELDQEVEFYAHLGFEISYQGDEFPGFVALRNNNNEFGLSEKKDFDPAKARDSFVWQMETDSFSKIIAICNEQGFEYASPKQYWQERDAWEMQVKTPNGYLLHLDKLGKD